MKSTLKKVIAFLLVFCFVFAFAACKDDNEETTTAAATTLAETTAAGETTAEATTAGETTTAASTTAVGETTTAAAAVTAPIGGNMQQVISFYNQYGNAIKAFKGKVTVTKKDGTVSKINSISPELVRGQAEGLLPNDYKDKGSKTFVNGVAGDTKLGNWLPRGDEPLSSIAPTGANGVKSAVCVASGTGCKITIVFNDDKTSGANALVDKPAYVSKGMETLDLGPDDLKPFKLKDANVNYTGCKIEAVFDAQGRLTKLDIATPANITGNLSLIGIPLVKADITGDYKGNFTLTY